MILCWINYSLVLYHILTETSSLLSALKTKVLTEPVPSSLLLNASCVPQWSWRKRPLTEGPVEPLVLSLSLFLKRTTAREPPPEAWLMDLSRSPSLPSSCRQWSVSLSKFLTDLQSFSMANGEQTRKKPVSNACWC